MDSNHRSLMTTDLQSACFNHLPTHPFFTHQRRPIDSQNLTSTRLQQNWWCGRAILCWDNQGEEWWKVSDLNRLPSACEADALPDELTPQVLPHLTLTDSTDQWATACSVLSFASKGHLLSAFPYRQDLLSLICNWVSFNETSASQHLTGTGFISTHAFLLALQ